MSFYSSNKSIDMSNSNYHRFDAVKTLLDMKNSDPDGIFSIEGSQMHTDIRWNMYYYIKRLFTFLSLPSSKIPILAAKLEYNMYTTSANITTYCDLSMIPSRINTIFMNAKQQLYTDGHLSSHAKRAS